MAMHQSIEGRRFGRLTVLSFCDVKSSNARWLCICDCGRERVVAACHLKSGHTTSCGCVRRTHGCSRSSVEYGIWRGMKTRCSNPRDPSFHKYGGRGIDVCKRWREDFAAFLADVGPRPSPAHSLERIDNSRGYESANVRWATPAEQARNTRRNHYLTFRGETRTVTDWAKQIGMSPTGLAARLRRSGMTVEQALTLPPGLDNQRRWDRRVARSAP